VTPAPGRAWELALREMHATYRRLGVAYIERLQPEVQVLTWQGGGAFRGQFRGKGDPDFAGYVVGGPVPGPVAFDAKSTHQLRWSFDHLAIEQARDLDARTRDGASCGLAIRFELVTPPWRSVWLPWPVLGPLWWRWHDAPARGALASLPLESAIELGREFRGADCKGGAVKTR